MVVTEKGTGVSSTENRLLSSKLKTSTNLVLHNSLKKSHDKPQPENDIISKVPRLDSSVVPNLTLSSGALLSSSLTTRNLSSSIKLTARIGSSSLVDSRNRIAPLQRPLTGALPIVPLQRPLTGAKAINLTSEPSYKTMPSSKKEIAMSHSVPMESVDNFSSTADDPYQYSIREGFLSSIWNGLTAGDSTDVLSLKSWKSKPSASEEPSVSLKLAMIDRLASALISMPNFSTPNSVADLWVSCLRQLASYDPEFILKLSLYAREELNIRTAANFLVAFAAFDEAARPFLQKYFGTTVRLPSDWLEIAELGQYFANKQKKYGEIPKALRVVMSKKFPEFDSYQLAKYNKEKARLKKAKKPSNVGKARVPKGDAMEVDSSSSDSEVEFVKAGSNFQPKRIFTLKRMIRCLHISEPVEQVMAILGKRYPATDSEFYNSRLPGTFDKSRAGKRMKLPVPETWETQISMKGNKPEVWESLLEHRKLPYMALLRNIRNLLRSGIDQRHHRLACDRLSDREQVIRSRQLPIRFLSAYEVLRQLEHEKEIFEKWSVNAKALHKKNNLNNRRGRPKVVSDPKNKQSAAIEALGKLMPKAVPASLPSIAKSLRKSKNYDLEKIGEYKKALNTALQVATTYNIQPIRGKTIIFLDMGAKHPIGGNNNPMGPCRTAAEAGAMLAFMCKAACEQCELFAYDGKSTTLYSVESEKGSILDQVASLKARFAEENSDDNTREKSADNNLVLTELLRLSTNRSLFDTVIWLDGQNSNHRDDNEVQRCLKDMAKVYVETIRASAIFCHVNLSPGGCRKDASRRVGQQLQQTISPYLVHLAGFSDAILRFIAERNDCSRLRYIDNIDKKYKLAIDVKRKRKNVKTDKVELVSNIDLFPHSNVVAVNGQAIRIFISSTFRDMHGERDLLTRFVIPQLRLNATKIGIQIYDVDLRWGVTEEDSTRSGSLNVCLAEARRADLFVGILAERYGNRPGHQAVAQASHEYPEVKGYEDRSVTELEIRVAALNENVAAKRNRAFFYFRDSSEILEKIPAKFAADFKCENSENALLLSQLKNEIRRSGLSVKEGYQADYGGVITTASGAKVCRVSHLEKFGEQVTIDLWHALTRIAEEKTKNKSQLDGEFEVSIRLHTQRLLYLTSSFVGRSQFCTDVVRRIKAGFNSAANLHRGAVILNGAQGSGKSAVVAQVVQEIINSHIAACVYFFADASPTCGTVRELVTHFGLSLLHIFRSLGISSGELEKLMFDEERTSPPNFVDLLNQIRESDPGLPILLVIDGIDAFQSDQAGLSFLPETNELIPENVVILLSCRSGTLAHASAQRLLKSSTSAQRPLTLEVEVPLLPVADRAAVVRAILSRYGKSLGDSAWDNQMSNLTQKRHAGLPAYLAMACEELRLFGLYEELSLRVRRLPHTISQLLGDILNRLESDHGKMLVEHACCLLAVAPSGLSETDLRCLIGLSHDFGVDGMRSLEPGQHVLDAPSRSVKMASFCQLIQSLRGFMSNQSALLVLADSNMLEIINHVYFGVANTSLNSTGLSRTTISVRAKSNVISSPGFEKKSAYCRLIATLYCSKLAKNTPVASVEPFVLADLPYFLTMAGCFQELARLLTSMHYLAARCASTYSVHELLEVFSGSNIPSILPAQIKAHFLEVFAANPSVVRMKGFVCRNALPLSMGFPHLMWQAALNDSDSAIVSAAAKGFNSVNAKLGEMAMIVRMLRDESPDNANTTKPLLITKSSQAILCVDVCHDYVAFGSEDTTVSVYQRNDGKLYRSFVGHAGPITAVCFSSPPGGSLKLFSASHDKTLSCWDVEAGNRLNVFENHQRPITGCSTSGRLLATSSTDCTVAVFDVVNNRMITKIYESCPLNAVALHPSGDGRLAVACWDTAVRLWSATPNQTTIPKRVAVFRGHAAPVTAAVFSPCGMYLAAGSLNGEIRLFLSEHGVQVGVLGGPNNFAVTCLRYMGNSLVSASADWVIRIWSRGLGRQIAAFCNNSRNTAGRLKTSATSHDGLTCMTTSKDNELVGFATKSGQIFVVPVEDFLKSPIFSPKTFKVDTALSPVLAVIFTSSEPRRLVYSCQNGTVRSLDVSSLDGRPGKRYDLVDSKLAVGSLASNNRYTATGSADSVVRVYENHPMLRGNSTEVSPSIIFPGHRATVTSLFMDEIYLLSGDMDGTCFVWSLNKRKSHATIVRAHGDAVSAVAMTKEQVITAGSDTIKAWTLNGEAVRQIGSHASIITTLSSSDGCVISGDCSGVIKVHTWRGVEVTSIKTGAASVVGLSINVELNKDSESRPAAEESEPQPVANWADECEREEMEREHASKKIKSPGERQRNVTVYCGNQDGWLRAYRPLEAEVRSTLQSHVGAVTSLATTHSKSTNGSFEIFSTSLDGICNSWTVTNDDDGMPGFDVISKNSTIEDPPIRSFFTADGRHFVVATTKKITVWRSTNMTPLTNHRVSKYSVFDACPSLSEPNKFYASSDNAVYAFEFDEDTENAPIECKQLSPKSILKLSSSQKSEIKPLGCIVSHPASAGKVYAVGKFHTVGQAGGLPLSIEYIVIDRDVMTAVLLADGRVYFTIPSDSTAPKLDFEFKDLAAANKDDLPLVAFLPASPGLAVVVGHRSGAAYLVDPCNSGQSVSLGTVGHSSSVTFVRANDKFLLTCSVNEQLVKLWRLAGNSLRLVGLLSFDAGRIADVHFADDNCVADPVLDLINDGSNDNGNVIIIDHLGVVRRFAIISNL